MSSYLFVNSKKDVLISYFTHTYLNIFFWVNSVCSRKPKGKFNHGRNFAVQNSRTYYLAYLQRELKYEKL